MLRITLRQLKIFDSVARHLSYSRAAEELHLTQPAVSMQVTKLEENLGLSLFEQLGKRIFLTESGHEMHQQCRSVLRQFVELEATVEAMKGLDRGRLTIAAVTLAQYFAPLMLTQFRRENPNVNLKLMIHNREDVVRLLMENEIDLAVMGNPPEDLDIVAQPFARNVQVMIAPPDYPLREERRIPLSRLANETFLVREPGSGTRLAMERLFAEHDLKLNAETELFSNETIKQAVMAGMGLSLVSKQSIALELEAGRLCVLDVKGLPVVRHWHVVHRAGKRLSPTARAFEQFLLTRAADLMGAEARLKDRP